MRLIEVLFGPACFHSLLVPVLAQSTTPEHQQAQALWELFLDTKTRLVAEALGETTSAVDFSSTVVGGDGGMDEPTDDETCNSFVIEVNDSMSSSTAAGDTDSVPPPQRVPVLKLKVAGGVAEEEEAGGEEIGRGEEPAGMPREGGNVGETLSEFGTPTSEKQTPPRVGRPARRSSGSELDEQHSEVNARRCCALACIAAFGFSLVFHCML